MNASKLRPQPRLVARAAAAFLLLLCVAATVVWAAAGEMEIVPPAEPHSPHRLIDQPLGQDFVAPVSFSQLTLKTPTWNTADSGCTARLYRHGPTGELLLEQAMANVPDNTLVWELGGTYGPGRYYVEIDVPVGTIGWWTQSEAYSRGTAYLGGELVILEDRELIIGWAGEE